VVPPATSETTAVDDPGAGTRPDRDPRGPRRPHTPRGGDPEPPPPVETPTPPPTTESTPPAQVEPRGPGFLSLVTSPWTNVTLDGRALGETPLVRVSLPAGNHTLRLRNPEAGIDETYEVTIRPGETTSRRLGLR
jgi:serine/threonine-protein kinase